MRAKLFGNTIALLGVTAVLLLAAPSQAAPVIRSGVDQSGATVNSDAAFSAWSADVGGFTLDNLDGLAGSTTSRTSSLGNNFVTTDDALGNLNFTFGVLEGVSLRLFRSGNLATFTWTLTTPSDAFGFFSRNNDGGAVTIGYQDGGTQNHTLLAAQTNSNGDNLFWGISGLTSNITSVAISTTDPSAQNGASSFWDRFVYRPATQVPEPGTLALIAAGLFGMARRRLA